MFTPSATGGESTDQIENAMISRFIRVICGFGPPAKWLYHSFVGPKSTPTPSILANSKTFQYVRRCSSNDTIFETDVSYRLYLKMT
jgi:hypothetical protein